MRNFNEALYLIDPVIKQETFINAQYSNENAQNRSKKFFNCTFKGSFALELRSSEIVFENCVFSDSHENPEFHFSDNSTLVFTNCQFKGGLVFSKIHTLLLTNNSIEGRLVFEENSFETVDILNEQENNSRNRINWIEFKNATNTSSVEFVNLHVGKLEFSPMVSKKIRLWGGVYDQILFNANKNVSNLQIFGNDFVDQKIKIGELQCKFLNLEGDILLKFAEIGKIDITPFNIKSGSMRWQGVQFTEEVKIQDSNLSNVQFNGIDFKRAKLYLDWSLLTELTIANISWPPDYNVHPNYTNKDREITLKLLTKGRKKFSDRELHQTLKNQREIYRQLKSVSLKNNNQIDALAFYKNEMNIYWLDIRLNKDKYARELNSWDHFLIFVNKYSSNFGQSYSRPLFLLLLFHFIGCYFIWFFESGKIWHLNFTNYTDLHLGVKQYFKWLIPIYSAPDFNSNFSLIVSVFLRVLNGFFIFHIIKASRKYGKI